MKKINLLSFAFLATLTSCGGYENLSTPFDYKSSRDANTIGASSNQANPLIGAEKYTSAPTAAYEISVNAPKGTVMNEAMDMFKREANKACGGENYSYEITKSGMTTVREYLNRQVITEQVPSVKGIVKCGTKPQAETASLALPTATITNQATANTNQLVAVPTAAVVEAPQPANVENKNALVAAGGNIVDAGKNVFQAGGNVLKAGGQAITGTVRAAGQVVGLTSAPQEIPDVNVGTTAREYDESSFYDKSSQPKVNVVDRSKSK